MSAYGWYYSFFFFNDTATTEIYTYYTLFPYTTLFRSAYITTDLDDNQITAFHPGAMAQADTQNVDGKGVKIGSVSAESREAMLLHRSEEHTSELQSLMRISYAVFCLKKKNK